MKFFNIIFKIIIAIILLLSFVLVGTPIQYNCLEFNIAIIAIGVIYGIYKLVFKKEKIILDKIDIVVLILQMTPLIPLIFGTYASLEETLIAITRNVSLFNIYYILKDLTSKKAKNKEYITSILIIGGLVLALLGIDELLSKEVFRYMRFIGIPNIINHEVRMFSTIGYANTFAVIMAVEIMLCLEMLKKHKLACSGLIYIFLLSMLLSYSRSVIAIFAVFLIVYLIFSKKNRKYTIYVFFTNLVLAVFGMKLFETFSINKQYIPAWASVALFTMSSVLIALLICKLYKKVCRIKLKTYIWIAIAALVLMVIVFAVGMQLTIPLNLFGSNEDNKETRYKLSRVNGDTPYTFEIDIEAYIKKVSNFADSNYTIEITEENKYYDTIASHKIQFGDYIGKKEISFTTSKDTVAMVIYFKSKSGQVQNGLVINSLHVNGKEIGLNYLYIPMRLVERIDSFSINSKSLWERFVYYIDGMKIIKDNWLFGAGTKGWIYNYAKVQSYVYSATEVHSYPFQLVIENGITALICYGLVIIYVIIKILKAKRLTGIDMAFILLNLHSAVDFNMSFYVVLIMWIVMLALMTGKRYNRSNGGKVQLKSIKYILQYGIIIINVITIVLGIYTFNLSKNTEATIDQINKLMRKDEYNEAVQLMKQIDEDKQGKSTVYSLLSRLEYEALTEQNLQYVYDNILNQEIIPSTGYNMMKSEMIQRILMEISNNDIATKLANLVVSENDKMLQNIKNTEVNRLPKEYVEMYLQRQQDVYKFCCEVLNEN